MLTASEVHYAAFTRRDLTPIREVITNIKKDSKLREEVASRSYLHENGFAKIVLAIDSSLRIRLHCWVPNTQKSELPGNIHSHRWDFESIILGGSLRETQYSIRPGIGSWLSSYSHDSFHDYTCEPIKQCDVEIIKTIQLTKNSWYYRPYNNLHRIELLEETPAFTLVAHGKPAVSNTQIISDARLPTKNPVRALKSEEIMNFLNEAMSHL